jgi:hypothetical protein
MVLEIWSIWYFKKGDYAAVGIIGMVVSVIGMLAMTPSALWAMVSIAWDLQ